MNDWIKVRDDLHEDTRVLKLSDMCRTEVEHMVGMLVRFWSWAGRQSADGTGLAITEGRLDRLVNFPGFTAAMVAVGWLAGEEGDYYIPRFERHNGSTAKARALEAEAKRLRREAGKGDKSSGKCRTSVGQVSDKSETESPTREEKRREEDTEKENRAGAGEEPVSSGSKWRTGMPTRQMALDYAAEHNLDRQEAARWFRWLEDKRSNHERYVAPTWTWWHSLENWCERATGKEASGRRQGAGAKETISNYTRPEDWTDANMTLPPPKVP
jgi:hypothetical protein